MVRAGGGNGPRGGESAARAEAGVRRAGRCGTGPLGCAGEKRRTGRGAGLRGERGKGGQAEQGLGLVLGFFLFSISFLFFSFSNITQTN